MSILELLSSERTLLMKGEMTQEILDQIQSLNQYIQEFKKQNQIKLLTEPQDWGKIEVLPNNVMAHLLKERIIYLLEEDQPFYWTTLLGTAISQLEEELETFVVFAHKNYGARDFLSDMEQTGTLKVWTDGQVYKNPQKLLKKENYSKKRS